MSLRHTEAQRLTALVEAQAQEIAAARKALGEHSKHEIGQTLAGGINNVLQIALTSRENADNLRARLDALTLAHERMREAALSLIGQPYLSSYFSKSARQMREALALPAPDGATVRAVIEVAEVADRYARLWKIVHDSDPRPPEGDERIQLGYVRGELFAAVDALRADPAWTGLIGGDK